MLIFSETEGAGNREEATLWEVRERPSLAFLRTENRELSAGLLNSVPSYQFPLSV